jgi:nucleoside-diphosphate-sugar epimerase
VDEDASGRDAGVSTLITGASGLIGRQLTAALDVSEEVWAVSRNPPPAASTNIRWIRADLSGRDFLSALPARVDTVIHLAQSLHHRDFPERAVDIFSVNVASTALLLDWSRRAGVRAFILASSGGVDRIDYTRHPAYYLATKRSAELLAVHYSDAFSITVLRFFFCYGAGQRQSMLVPRLVRSVREGMAVTLAGRDGISLNPIHVSDAAEAIVCATALHGCNVIDVAGPDVLTLREMASVIGSKVGREPRFAIDEQAPPAELIGDITEMRARLMTPRRSFASGVDDLIAAPVC